MADAEERDTPPPQLRAAYLDELAFGQELFLEQLVQTGRCWVVGNDAYGVVCDGTLVELHVAVHARSDAASLYAAIVAASGAASVLAKTFDHLLLRLALDRSAVVEPIGALFRSFDAATARVDDSVLLRRAEGDDIAWISRTDTDFFTDVDEIHRYADAGGLFVAWHEGARVGCGVTAPVVASRPETDLGMWIDPAWRGRRLGRAVIAALASASRGRGGTPICGCAIDNRASMRSLRRAGFGSEHRIVRITPS